MKNIQQKINLRNSSPKEESSLSSVSSDEKDSTVYQCKLLKKDLIKNYSYFEKFKKPINIKKEYDNKRKIKLKENKSSDFLNDLKGNFTKSYNFRNNLISKKK